MAACGENFDQEPDNQIKDQILEGNGIVRIGADQYSVQDLVAHSQIGNAHDFYTAQVTLSETDVLTLSFTVYNGPDATPLPVEGEEMQFPADDSETRQPLTGAFGSLLQAGTAAQSLFGGVRGTLAVSGGHKNPLFSDIELTFPAAEFSREEHTESYPEIYVQLPEISFPQLQTP